MASFSSKSFDKKLKEMSSRQDSVQTVSLWLIHHRAHSKAIVGLWLDRVKKAKPDRRLLLFYLANDVIQNSRKKGKEFSQSFSKVLGDSMQYLRDTSIRPSVERVLKIWQERKVFDKNLVPKLLDLLNNVSAKPKPKPKPEATVPKKENDKVKKEKKPKRPVPANFKTMNVTRAIATMQGIEDDTERRQTLVNQMRLDASSSDGIKQLKDYAGGNRFSLEFEESSTKYEDLLQTLQGESQHRQVLINLLEDGDAYYQAALKEATIIANAYRSFGNRLHLMKKKLDNKIRKFATAEKEAPVSAPKASFLASGLSGIFEQMNQSPAGTPSRSETEKTSVEKAGEDIVEKEGKEKPNEAEEKLVDPSIDHVEVSDMDLDSDSENGGDTSVPVPTDTSAVSTPKLDSSATTTASPVVTTPNTTSPSIQAKPQYGYTMTVNSTDENDTSSPASHTSAPSPDGSPDLGLEIYEGPPAVNPLPSNQLGVMTGQTFLGGVTEQKIPSNSSGSDTMNMLTQLMNKQNDDSSVQAEDSYVQGSGVAPAPNEGSSRPLMNLLGNLLGPLVHLQQNPQQGEVSQSGEATNMESFDPNVAPNQAESMLADEASAKLDSGPSTDEEGAGGDNTPEHGLDFTEAPPIIIRSDTMFPRPPIPPNFPGSAQVFQNRPPLGRPTFMSPERMARFPNELDIFMRDGPRRPSIEEHLGPPHGVRSPRMHGPPMEWDRGSPFVPRANVPPVRENRDPRLRRREMGRPGEGPPFIDRVPPLEMRGRHSGMGHPVDGVFIERQGHPPLDIRDEREQMIRRRPSLGNERDGPMSIEERDRHIWEIGGHPPMEMRPDMHSEMRDVPYPFETHQRGVEMRERFHPMERDRHIDGPLPIERRDGIPHMRGDISHSLDSRHSMDRPDLHGRGPSIDGSNSTEHHNEFHPPKGQGAPEEVPTSEEELPNIEKPSDKSMVGALPQEQNPEDVFHEGGNEPKPEGSQTDKPEDHTEESHQNEQLDRPIFHPGIRPEIRPSNERSVFDIRPEFNVDNHGPAFGPPGRRDDNRPIRPLGGPFGPRHEGRGRFPGPRNFHPNFRPRNFRPRYEHEGGRPRFPPMHGGPRLKRHGPPFHPDHAKRPHY